MSPAGAITLLNGFFLITLTLLAYAEWVEMPLVFSYQMHKMLHLLGIMLFFGNMVVGPVWLLLSFQTKEIKTIRYAARLLQITDVWIMIPAVDLALVNGLAMAEQLGGIQANPWLRDSVFLLLLMWLLAIPTVFIQERMHWLINQGVIDGEKFRRVWFSWSIIGSLVSIPPALVLYLMVFKGW